MSTFSIEGFAASCEQAIAAGTGDGRAAARAHLEQALREHSAAEIVAALEAAIPAGASIGEMIVYSSPKLTLLYARAPGRFRSGIHNHTVCAVMGQLVGEERSTLYERTEDGKGLSVTETMSIKAGEVMDLPADAIHHIENPSEETSSALHLYGGDFRAISHRRSLWSTEGHEEQPFSFEALLQQSVLAMKKSGNDKGLAELTQAIPAIKPMVDAL